MLYCMISFSCFDRIQQSSISFRFNFFRPFLCRSNLIFLLGMRRACFMIQILSFDIIFQIYHFLFHANAQVAPFPPRNYLLPESGRHLHYLMLFQVHVPCQLLFLHWPLPRRLELLMSHQSSLGEF